MGSVLSADISHYRGEIKDRDYVVIASNNLASGVGHKYTKEPFYLSKYEEITDKLYMEPASIINDDINLPIFEIQFKNKGIVLKLLNNDLKYKEGTKWNGELYLGIDSITGHSTLNNTPTIFNTVDIPNSKAPMKWGDKSILTDVGYILQESNTGSAVNWEYVIEGGKNTVTYNQIRLIPLISYYKYVKKNGEKVCMKYPNNSSSKREQIKYIINNDISWAKTIFNGEPGNKYQKLYTSEVDCNTDDWYEYCINPNYCSDYCRGPCLDKSNKYKCRINDGNYKCSNISESISENVDSLTVYNDYTYVYVVIIFILVVLFILLFLI